MGCSTEGHSPCPARAEELGQQEDSWPKGPLWLPPQRALAGQLNQEFFGKEEGHGLRPLSLPVCCPDPAQCLGPTSHNPPQLFPLLVDPGLRCPLRVQLLPSHYFIWMTATMVPNPSKTTELLSILTPPTPASPGRACLLPPCGDGAPSIQSPEAEAFAILAPLSPSTPPTPTKSLRVPPSPLVEYFNIPAVASSRPASQRLTAFLTNPVPRPWH